MRAPSSLQRGSAGANMTPMIDVVFLLIIFFLVSSHLAKQENRLPLELPVASTHDPADPDKAPLTISLDRNTDIRVGGDIVSIDALRAVLDDLMIRRGADAAIRIRCQQEVPYRFVEPILRQAALAGVTDAAIAVREDSRPSSPSQRDSGS